MVMKKLKENKISLIWFSIFAVFYLFIFIVPTPINIGEQIDIITILLFMTSMTSSAAFADLIQRKRKEKKKEAEKDNEHI